MKGRTSEDDEEEADCRLAENLLRCTVRRRRLRQTLFALTALTDAALQFAVDANAGTSGKLEEEVEEVGEDEEEDVAGGMGLWSDGEELVKEEQVLEAATKAMLLEAAKLRAATQACRTEKAATRAEIVFIQDDMQKRHDDMKATAKKREDRLPAREARLAERREAAEEAEEAEAAKAAKVASGDAWSGAAWEDAGGGGGGVEDGIGDSAGDGVSGGSVAAGLRAKYEEAAENQRAMIEWIKTQGEEVATLKKEIETRRLAQRHQQRALDVAENDRKRLHLEAQTRLLEVTAPFEREEIILREREQARRRADAETRRKNNAAKALAASLYEVHRGVCLLDAGNSAALVEAAFEGEEAEVRRLLVLGFDLESKERSGATALSEAAVAGHDRVVGLLLALGADPNSKAMFGGQPRTPITRAVHNGHTSTVSLLLEHGAFAESARWGASGGFPPAIRAVLDTWDGDRCAEAGKAQAGRLEAQFASFSERWTSQERRRHFLVRARATLVRCAHGGDVEGLRCQLEEIVEREQAWLDTEGNGGGRFALRAGENSGAGGVGAAREAARGEKGDEEKKEKEDNNNIEAVGSMATTSGQGQINDRAAATEIVGGLGADTDEAVRVPGVTADMRDTECGRTLLSIAAWRGHGEVVEMLLCEWKRREVGSLGQEVFRVDVDARFGPWNGTVGWTPFGVAAFCNHAEVIGILRRHGANPLLGTSFHLDAFHLSTTINKEPGAVVTASLTEFLLEDAPGGAGGGGGGGGSGGRGGNDSCSGWGVGGKGSGGGGGSGLFLKDRSEALIAPPALLGRLTDGGNGEEGATPRKRQDIEAARRYGGGAG